MCDLHISVSGVIFLTIFPILKDSSVYIRVKLCNDDIELNIQMFKGLIFQKEYFLMIIQFVLSLFVSIHDL